MRKLAHMTRRNSSRVPVFSLGERIRKVREDLGLSQQAFAGLLNVDRKTVSNWEGERNRPRYGDLMLISSVADISLEWLAGELFRPTSGVVGGDGSSQEASRDTRGYGEARRELASAR